MRTASALSGAPDPGGTTTPPVDTWKPGLDGQVSIDSGF